MVLVPDLTGFARQSAVDELRRQGLLARINQEENVQAVPDTVLRQSPPAGTQLEEGSTVQVWVGTHPGAIQVPNLVGMPLDKAQTALNTLGLLLGATTYQASEEMEQGYVLKQNPPGGGQAMKGSAVDLVLAERKSSFPPMPPAPRPGGGEETTPPAPPKTTAEIVPLSVSEQDQAIGTKEVEVRITVAPGEGPDHRILIVLKDDEGERTVAQETLSPGSPYHEVFQAQGKATLKVLDNDQEIKSKSF
jgi:beta-lactam-binding protein with PASTA domain